MSQLSDAPRGVQVLARANSVVLRLYGEVGFDILASETSKALEGAQGKPVSVHVFSYGGSAGEGLAIYNILKAHKGGVETVIDGIAASAGGLIFMAGDKRKMPENSLFHIHSTWGSASGPAEEMRSKAEMFEAHSNSYRDIYASTSGQEPSQVDEWMKASGGSGTWFTAAEAQAAGFATELVDPVEIAAAVRTDVVARFPAVASLIGAPSRKSFRMDTQTKEAMATSASAAEAATPNEPTAPAQSPPAPQATQVAAPQASVTSGIADAKAEIERLKRENSIRTCAAHANLRPEQVQELIDSGKPFEQCATEIVKAHAQATTEAPQASVAGHPAQMSVTRDGGDTLARAFEDELSRRAGLIQEPTAAGKLVFGYSAKELCRAWLNRNGVNTDGRSVNWLIAQAFHSTSDLPALFENTMNRSLKDAYEEEPQTWGPLSSRQDLPDFKQATEVDFGSRLIPQPLQEGGAYKTGVVRDGKGTWSIITYGLEVGITRQMIINDDLSALGEVPSQMGRGARLLESNLVWNLVTKPSLGETVSLDNKALFHADHNNTISGATSVIGIAGMDAAKVKLRKQQDASGNSLNLRPAYLLAPPELETNALQFLFPTGYAPTNLTGANGPNPFAGGVELIIENRLAEVTNGTKMWYLTSSPGRVPMIRHGYLQGEAGPTITQEEKRNPDVLSLLVRIDFGCALRDWRGFVRSAGE